MWVTNRLFTLALKCTHNDMRLTLHSQLVWQYSLSYFTRGFCFLAKHSNPHPALSMSADYPVPKVPTKRSAQSQTHNLSILPSLMNEQKSINSSN